MFKEKKYYVYVHRYASGPKVGQVFYVGKGKDCRYSRPSYRSDWWGRIVDKYGFIPEKMMFFKEEACALSFEVALIRHYGRENLCNLTDGGDGATNITEYQRQKKRDFISGYNHNLLDTDIHSFVHEDGTIFVGLRYDFCRIFNISNTNAFRLVNKERTHVKRWMNWDCDIPCDRLPKMVKPIIIRGASRLEELKT